MYRKFWRRVNEFSWVDKDVLSTVQSVHIAKVMRGKYAYLNDLSGFVVEILNNCALMTLKDELLPLQYAGGLQEHSAYREDFSHM